MPLTNDIIQGNKLIEKFDVGSETGLIEYHNSYHLMMPVVKKINDLCQTIGYVDDIDLFVLRVIGISEKTLFISLTQFITWFNENIKK